MGGLFHFDKSIYGKIFNILIKKVLRRIAIVGDCPLIIRKLEKSMYIVILYPLIWKCSLAKIMVHIIFLVAHTSLH